MTLPEKDAKQLIELLSPAWDGTLTAEDNERINDFLERHGQQGAETLLKVTSVHLELSKHVSSSALYERIMESICEVVRSGSEDFEKSTQFSVKSEPRPQAWSRVSLLAIAASISLLLVGIQVVKWQPQEVSERIVVTQTSRLLRPSRPIANLASLSDAVWAEGLSLNVGQTLDENMRLELLSGSAQLSMACGADIVLQAPCKVTLVTEDFVQLESGKLTAQAAEWATGFVVAARDLRVTDLGTRFALSASDNGVVEAHVLEGSVLAEPLKERRQQQSSMLLKSGQAIRVDGVRSKVDLIDTRRNDFVDALDEFRPLRPIHIWNTGVGEAVGEADPHWRIVSGSQGFGPYPRFASITDGDTRSYEDNRPEVSQWISVSPEGYPGVPPESTHTFETTFDLTGYDLETVRVVGHFLVDDAINDLRINGHSIEYERWATTWDVFDFQSFHPIEINDHFLPGKNTITIVVYNSPSRPDTPADSPNPTALRIEWHAFGCLSESVSN